MPPQVNERYLPQLASVLSFPQSVGIVGGRPGASLYFVGVQGGAVLYLDPHEVQEVSRQHCTGTVMHLVQAKGASHYPCERECRA